VSILKASLVLWIKTKLGTEVGLGLREIVLNGYPAPLPQRGTAPQTLGHVYRGQTAGWIKMQLGTEIGLDPGDIVLDGDPAPLPQRGNSPQFLAHVYCGQTVAHLTYC